MVEPSIREAVRRYLGALGARGVAARFGFVFGSQADGSASAESDIDLVVISPAFDGPCDHETKMKLWEATAFSDARIEPVPCGEKEWEAGQGSVFMFVDKGQGEIVAR